MLALNFFKLLKRTNSVRSKNQIITKINGKQDFSSHMVNFEAKNESVYDKIYNECIKNGLSAKTIYKNEWIFKLKISK
jgi:hypothetical protein